MRKDVKVPLPYRLLHELNQAGWKESPSRWFESPDGVKVKGVLKAWQAMKAQGK
jgi:hypothetical protein